MAEETQKIFNFILSEEQVLLQDMARQFFRDKVGTANLRKLRDSEDADGIDRDIWQEAVALGFAGILIPEEYGGTGFGLTGMGLVMQEAGRVLAATPLLSSSIISSLLVLQAGNETQRREILPKIADGSQLIALALDESGHHNPSMVNLSAVETDGGLTLNGQKTFVLDGHIANQFIVVARSSGQSGETDGLTLCLVDAQSEGLTITRTKMVDSRNAAELQFENVQVSPDAILGQIGAGFDPLEAALDKARIALSAEVLGGIEEVFDRTLDYLKERKQFGVPIGSFQALRHRAAHMFGEIEVCRSIVAYSLSQADKQSNHLPRLASLAKARLSETATLVTNEGLQMHGGIGMTDDVDIGLFMKRARVQSQIFGDTRFHRDRYAQISGY